MRKLIVSEFISLDGVIENPAWTFPYWNDDIAKFKFTELFGIDDLLLGRVTYEGFAEAWPGRKDEQGYADRINSMPKHVVSTTLQNPTWTGSTVISENLEAAVNALKQQPGQDILIFGSGKLVQSLMALNLVDQFNLLVYPVVLGTGDRLFKDGSTATLKLVESVPDGKGVTRMIYETAPAK
jgi:dihydrofolate reductase